MSELGESLDGADEQVSSLTVEFRDWPVSPTNDGLVVKRDELLTRRVR
jgi:hypothetical protein